MMGADAKVVAVLELDEAGAARSAQLVQTEVRKVGTQTDQTQKQLGRLGSAFKTLIGPLLGVAAAVQAVRAGFRLLSESVKLAGIQQIADRKLEQAIRNTGAAVEEWAPKLQAAADQLQATSNYGDEMTQTAQAMLLSFKEAGGPEGVEFLTSRLGDMAAGVTKTSGAVVDLNQMAALMGRALTTGASALKRVGVSLSEAEEEAFNAAEGMDKVRILGQIIDSNFKGLASAIADPFQQAKNAAGDLKEELGTGLRVALAETANEFTRIAQSKETISFVRRLGAYIALGARGFIDIAKEALAYGRTLIALGQTLNGFRGEQRRATEEAMSWREALARGRKWMELFVAGLNKISEAYHNLRAAVLGIRAADPFLTEDQQQALLDRADSASRAANQAADRASAALMRAWEADTEAVEAAREAAENATLNWEQLAEKFDLAAEAIGGSGGVVENLGEVAVEADKAGDAAEQYVSLMKRAADEAARVRRELTDARMNRAALLGVEQQSALLSSQLDLEAKRRELLALQNDEHFVALLAVEQETAYLERQLRLRAAMVEAAASGGVEARGTNDARGGDAVARAYDEAELMKEALRDVEGTAVDAAQSTGGALAAIANDYRGVVSGVLGGLSDTFQTAAALQARAAEEAAERAGKSREEIAEAGAAASKRAFAAYKAVAIGEAIASTYVAANKALASAPPPFNYALAAAVVASGLANVARIRASQPSGSTSGGGSTQSGRMPSRSTDVAAGLAFGGPAAGRDRQRGAAPPVVNVQAPPPPPTPEVKVYIGDERVSHSAERGTATRTRRHGSGSRRQ